MDNQTVQSAETEGAQWKQVGQIRYCESEENVLGTGCDGTIVFRGELDDGRKVAVKRVNKHLPYTVRETDLLVESDFHSNVLRFYCLESDSYFRYLALELCVASLDDYVKKKDVHLTLNIAPREILYQSTVGLAHLHSLRIVHRDLKPHNILFAKSGNGITTVKLSDFGISKKVHPDKDALTYRSGAMGTEGWIAPEALRDGESTSYPMDVFSLGCIFYHVLSEGKHPFGDPFLRNSNIIRGKSTLKHLDRKQHLLSYHLISLAISSSPSHRPTASAILLHPYFWDTKKLLDFISYTSDLLTDESNGSSVLLDRLEKNGSEYFVTNWHTKICSVVLKDLLHIRPYKENSVRDLLRAIRNYKNHYWQRPVAVQEALGFYPDGIVNYFTSRFPDLILHVYKAMEWRSSEIVFIPFYSDEVRIRINIERAEMEKKFARGIPNSVKPTAPLPVSPLVVSTSTIASKLKSQALPVTPQGSSAFSVPLTVESKNMQSGKKNGKSNEVMEPPKNAANSGEQRTPSQGENWIGLLSEFCAKNKLPPPEYLTEEAGPPFTTHVAVGDFIENGSGMKKKESKSEAAKILYETIQSPGVWVGKLSEFCSKNRLPQPVYTPQEGGPPFAVHVLIGSIFESGIGNKKKDAKGDAARKLFAVVRKQVGNLQKAPVQTDEEKGVRKMNAETIKKASSMVPQTQTETDPQNALKAILSDKTRFLRNYSVNFREVQSAHGRIQTNLTIQFTMVSSPLTPARRRVFCGEGVDAKSARDEAARAASTHFLTYE